MLGEITLVVQGVPALISAAAQIKESWDLFSAGQISKEELEARWKKAGVSWQTESLALKASMDRAQE